MDTKHTEYNKAQRLNNKAIAIADNWTNGNRKDAIAALGELPMRAAALAIMVSNLIVADDERNMWLARIVAKVETR